MKEKLANHEKKRLDELSIFKQFLELCEFQIKEYSQPKTDPPDITGKTDNITFSIEITKLFNLNGEKIIQRQKLIDRLTKELNAKSKNSIIHEFGVLFDLKKEIKINKKEEEKLIDSMIKIVQKKVDENPNEIYLNFKVSKEELPPEISKFELRRFKEIKGKSWYTRKSWMSGPLADTIIINNIASKTESALKNGYHTNYDQNWLLLVVENEPHSDLSEFERNINITSNNIFDKVYILEKFENKLTELTLLNNLKS